ncbi:MAG: hypothetical protein GQ557_02725 [Mycoplasmataceae bacterium]|nr:hypothetical protein [Mycoplasmataceae bacterium]
MEKIILLVHGYKRPKKHDFDHFEEYAKERVSIPLKKIYWFDNFDKKTMKTKAFIENFNLELKKYHDKDITIISYSMGASLAIQQAYLFDNVIQIIAVYPTFFVYYFDWIKQLKNVYKKRKKIKKQLSKERYKRLLLMKKSGLSEKYPIRLTLQINSLRKKLGRKKIKATGKQFEIFLNNKDEINNTNKSFKKIKKQLSERNNVNFHWINDSHYSTLDRNQNHIFDKIIDLI